MTQSFGPQTAAVATFVTGSGVMPGDALLDAVLSCELVQMEKVIQQYQENLPGLMAQMEVLGPKINRAELLVSARKFSFKRGSTLKWAAWCEFRLVRAHRLLLIPSAPEFSSLVIKIDPGTSGAVCCDSPELLMRQIGKIAALPVVLAAPPMAG